LWLSRRDEMKAGGQCKAPPCYARRAAWTCCPGVERRFERDDFGPDVDLFPLAFRRSEVTGSGHPFLRNHPTDH
jgi:hypothetical protein